MRRSSYIVSLFTVLAAVPGRAAEAKRASEAAASALKLERLELSLALKEVSDNQFLIKIGRAHV